MSQSEHSHAYREHKSFKQTKATQPTYVNLMLGLIWLGLAVVPAYLYLCDVALFPRFDLTHWFAQGLFFLTSTGTSPYGILTVLLVLLVSAYSVPSSIRRPMILTVCLSLMISFSLNHTLKAIFAESRPNFSWLSEQLNSQFDVKEFYSQPAEQRSQQVASALQQLRDKEDPTQLNSTLSFSISPILQQHWIDEVGYAFPSGHTMFATTLALTLSYFLLLGGAFKLTVLINLWAWWMGISRMVLGMHWSQDVLASVCLSGVIMIICIFYHRIIRYLFG
ncbi:MAG: phosphatase PAP2 family protein [Vibrio sp.]